MVNSDHWNWNAGRFGRVLTDTEVIHSLSIEFLNTVFLAGKALPRVPELITNLAYSCLRFVGVLYLDVQLRAAVKSGGDLLFAASNLCWQRAAYTASHLAVHASGALLTVGGAVAGVAITLNNAGLARWMFSVMSPWGLAALVLQIFLDGVAHLTDGPLLEQMARSKAAVLRSFVQGSANPSDVALAAAIRSRIDPTTWGELSAKIQSVAGNRSYNPITVLLRSWRLSRLYSAAMRNIHTQQQYARTNLVLTAIGYTAMGITRAYPHTLIEAGINWTISGFYTSRLIFKKYAEAAQQDSIAGA